MIVRELITKLGFDVDDKGLKQANDALDSFKKKAAGLRNIGLGLTAAITAPFLAFAYNSIKAASDAQETENLFRQVFGNITQQGTAFAEQLGDAVGRSTIDIKKGLATFQQFGQGLGMAGEDAFAFSKELQSLSLDFASIQNVSDQEAMQRFISALSGSTEVMDKFGINLKVAALEQAALRQGITKSYDEMSELEKATLRLSVIRDVLGKNGAIGDAVRTSGSFANVMKAFQAQIKDLNIAFGEELLPYATDFLKSITKLIRSFGELSPGVKKAILAFGAFLAIIGPILAIIGQLLLSFAALKAAAAFLGVGVGALLLLFGKIIAIGALIVGAIAGILLIGEDFYVWLNGGESAFGDWYQAAWDSIKAVGRGFVWLWDKTKAIFSLIKDWIINQFKLAFFGVLRIMTMNLSKMAQLISKVTGTDFYDKTFKNFDKFIDAEIQGSAKFLTEDSVNRAKGILGIENNNNQRISNSITLNIENTDATPEVIAETTKDALQEFFDSQINDGLYNLQVD